MLLKLRRKFSALLVALLVFSLFSPGVALADSWYMGLQKVYVNDNASSFDSVVVAPNQYAAAAYVMGAEPQLLTDEQKSYLSDGLFCPNFCQYAASFQEFDPLAPPDWLPQYVYVSLVASGIGVAALGNKRYVSSASNFLFQDAKEELQAVLSGDYPSSGGGGSVDPTNNSITCYLSNIVSTTTQYQNSYKYFTLYDGVKYTLYQKDVTSSGYAAYPEGNKVTVNVPESVDLSEWSDCFCSLTPQGGNKFYFSFYLMKPGTWSYTGTGKDTLISLDGYLSSTSTSLSIDLSGGLPLDVTLDRNFNESTDTRSFLVGDAKLACVNDTSLNPGGGGGDSDPSGDWPEDPVTPSPTPPPLPDPGTNTFPTEPTETDISVNLPDINVTVGGSATDLTDVISILKVINGNLVTINDNLEDEFNSVINAFNAIGGQIEQLAQRIREHCIHIRQAIYQNTTHLENEIYKLFHWLKDELDFGFDDSSIVDYLRRILDKLNNVSYQPNPIADPFNFFDWLMGLLGGFLASLVSGLPGVLQDLLTDLSSLTEYFPFSMPWDVYGLLLLFAHDPVTPVFDLPWNFAANHTAQIHIDLSQYDGIMAIVRAVEKVIFAAGLAVFTMRMFKPTDVLGDD